MAKQQAAQSVTKQYESAGSPVSLDEVIAHYPGDWILLQVTGYDEDHIPSEGHVVGRWADTRANDRRVSKALSDVLAAEAETGERYYLFQAYPRIQSGDALRDALAELVNDAGEGVTGAPQRR